MGSQRGKENKVIDLAEAVRLYVHPGCSICLGGFGGRESMAAVIEIIRQGITGLTVIDDMRVDPVDILIGAGSVVRFEGAYVGSGVLGLGFNFRRAVERNIPHRIEVVDYSTYSMSLRFLAGSMGIPFLPTKTLMGSDILRYNRDVRIISNPYSEGEKLTSVPAANPDVAVIHVQKADQRGNSQIWGLEGNDAIKARAAKNVIITCEELVSAKEIQAQPNLTAIPEYCVDAVALVSFGSYWLSVRGYYIYDFPAAQAYAHQARTREGFLKWLGQWVYDSKNHQDFCKKVGPLRLKALAGLERKSLEDSSEKNLY